jgi:hypothetical protein
MNIYLTDKRIDEALHLLNHRLEWNDAPRIGLVICGSALVL